MIMRFLQHRLRFLIPPTRLGLGYLIIAVLVAVGLYVVRVHVNEIIMDAGLGLFFLGEAVLILGGASFLAFVLLCRAYAQEHHAYWLPLIVLPIGILIAWHLPLPVSGAEQEYALHRTDYDAVVRLANTNQLVSSTHCLDGVQLPVRYQHLTRGCVRMIRTPALALVFDPPTTHYRILYAQTPEAFVALTTCCLDGRVDVVLNQHWYLFVPAQD